MIYRLIDNTDPSMEKFSAAKELLIKGAPAGWEVLILAGILQGMHLMMTNDTIQKTLREMFDLAKENFYHEN